MFVECRDWSTPGPTSFLNSPDCMRTLCLECSILLTVNVFIYR